MKGITWCIVAIALLISVSVSAKPRVNVTNVDSAYFDANRIFCFMQANGIVVSNDVTGGSGLLWQQEKHSVGYMSGLGMIGKINGELRTAWCEYSSEFTPGPAPDDAIDSSASRIYKIRQNGGGDWLEWPWQYGAPVLKTATGVDSLDENGNRIPRLLGDQTLWMVVNDFEDEAHERQFSTHPLGVEVQITVFGFDDVPPYSDMMFVKWLFINKGGNTIEDAYVTLFYDYDIGDASNDRVGCDTTLSLGYGYANSRDDIFGDNSPGAGFVLLQGPLVPAPGKVGKCFGRIVLDHTNLPMTSFIGYG